MYRAIAEDVDIKDLERIPEESHYPLEIYYKLDDIRLMYLLRNCRNIFKGQEYSAMEEFIHRHKDDGVLLLKATYKIQLTEMAKPRKKAIKLSVCLKKRQNCCEEIGTPPTLLLFFSFLKQCQIPLSPLFSQRGNLAFSKNTK